MNTIGLKEKKFNKLITIVSIIVPVVVAILFGVKIPNVAPLSFLPPIYASINGITAVLLIIAVIAIKNGKRKVHQNIMTICIGLSLVFLVLYIGYHMTSESTKFGGEGAIKYIYYFILITHIVLSIAIIPIVLRTYAKAYLEISENSFPHLVICCNYWCYCLCDDFTLLCLCLILLIN